MCNVVEKHARFTSCNALSAGMARVGGHAFHDDRIMIANASKWA